MWVIAHTYAHKHAHNTFSFKVVYLISVVTEPECEARSQINYTVLTQKSQTRAKDKT